MEHIQKVDALNRLAVIESEAQKLRAIIEQPEAPRTPKAGDVWKGDFTGEGYIIGSISITLMSSGQSWLLSTSNFPEGYTYLGKFSEVYVRRDGHVSIADVRDALSIEDEDGDSFLKFNSTFIVASENYEQGREALAKLGITAK